MNMDSAEILDIDFRRIAELGNDLLPALDIMREAAPVVWSPSANAWIVTRHSDVVQAFAGDVPLSMERFSSMAFGAIPVEEFFAKLPITANTIPHWIVNMDPPRHTRLRKLMTRAFSRKVIEDVRPFAQATIKRVLDGLSPPCDIEFLDEVARAITGRVILHLFGLPEVHLASFQKWSYALNTALGAPQPPMHAMEGAETALREMRDVFLPEIAARKAQPRGDFLTQLVQARDGDDRLEDEEVMGICYVALIAGHDTTMNSMALGVDTLLRHPGQIRYMLEHPDNIVNSVMEVTRLSAMSTSQPRAVGADFEWHGKQLRKGELVLVMVAAANRDPRVFSHPLELDLSRPTEQVVTFGPGIHHCIGHLLAKMQLGEFFPAFFRRFDAQVLDESLRFIPSIAFRGLESMHVRLREKQA
jgi:cytochrome P450